MYVCSGVAKGKKKKRKGKKGKEKKKRPMRAVLLFSGMWRAQQQPPPALAPPPLDGMLGLVGECWGPILMPLASLFMSKTPS